MRRADGGFSTQQPSAQPAKESLLPKPNPGSLLRREAPQKNFCPVRWPQPTGPGKEFSRLTRIPVFLTVSPHCTTSPFRGGSPPPPPNEMKLRARAVLVLRTVFLMIATLQTLHVFLHQSSLRRTKADFDTLTVTGFSGDRVRGLNARARRHRERLAELSARDTQNKLRLCLVRGSCVCEYICLADSYCIASHDRVGLVPGARPGYCVRPHVSARQLYL